MSETPDPTAPIVPPARRQTARPGVILRVPGDGRLTGPTARTTPVVASTRAHAETAAPNQSDVEEMADGTKVGAQSETPPSTEPDVEAGTVDEPDTVRTVPLESDAETRSGPPAVNAPETADDRSVWLTLSVIAVIVAILIVLLFLTR